MRATHFIVLVMLSVFLWSCSKNNNVGKQNGALQALQLNAHQKSYPRAEIKSNQYFQETEKWERNNKVSAREELPDPWETIGPHNISGRTLAIAINPQNNKTIYAGSASGGLWKSHNQGKGISWEQVPLGFPVLGVSSIAFATNDSMTIYIGTGEVYNINAAGTGAAYRNTRGTYGMGILKSEDGGLCWNKSLDWSYEIQKGIHVVKVSPSDPNIVYAGTTHGVYQSIDAGENWVQILDIVLCTDLVIHPDDPYDIIVGCGNFGSSGKGIYATINGGSEWTFNDLTNFQGKIQLAQYDSKPEFVYASVGNGFGFEDGATWVYRTSNRGLTWSLEGNTDYSQWQGWFAHDIAVHPFNLQKLTLVGIEIYQSENGGRDAEQITVGGVAFGTPPIGEPDGNPNFTHSDHHDVIYDPKDGNTIYVANDGGVYGSFNGGESWQSLNGGYQTTQFYNGFSVFDSDNTDFAMGGLQDNSTIEYNGTKAWNRVIGGDGSWSALHPTNSSIRYGSLQNLNVFKTTNGSIYNGIFIPGAGQPTSFIAPYVLSPSNPEVMYAGRANVYKSLNAGDNWSTHQGINSDFAFSMDVSQIDENVLYVATAPNADRPRIYYTKDGAETFTDITGDIPDQYINDIFSDYNDPDLVYLTLGGFGDAHVFKSIDAGENWIDITSNLPRIPTSAIISDPADDQLLYVGNDYGVFYSEDGGFNWNEFNEGITDAILVMDLKINRNKRKLYVATHGSGAFVRDMIEREDNTLVEELSVEKVKIVQNPVRDHLIIKGLDHVDIKSINIVDIGGHTIQSALLENLNITEEFNWQLNNYLPNGQYFLSIHSHSGSKSIPFQIMH